LARRVDQACDRFERAWQAGPRPRLEDFLEPAPAAERGVLLRELIIVDVERRRWLGESPQPHDYAAYLPELDPAWLARLLEAPVPAADGPAVISFT
jgi:serine/threonine-protein kinase